MSNILFITEGLVDEVNFINNIYNICYKNKKYNIYSYKTTIHTLVSKLFVNDKIDEQQAKNEELQKKYEEKKAEREQKIQEEQQKRQEIYEANQKKLEEKREQLRILLEE